MPLEYIAINNSDDYIISSFRTPKDAFEGNREINGLIIFTFVIVLLSFRQTFRLSKRRLVAGCKKK